MRAQLRPRCNQRHGAGGDRGQGVTATRSLCLDIATERAGSEDACVRCAASAERREREKIHVFFFLLKHMCVV